MIRQGVALTLEREQPFTFVCLQLVDFNRIPLGLTFVIVLTFLFLIFGRWMNTIENEFSPLVSYSEALWRGERVELVVGWRWWWWWWQRWSPCRWTPWGWCTWQGQQAPPGSPQGSPSWSTDWSKIILDRHYQWKCNLITVDLILLDGIAQLPRRVCRASSWSP